MPPYVKRDTAMFNGCITLCDMDNLSIVKDGECNTESGAAGFSWEVLFVLTGYSPWFWLNRLGL